MATDREYQEAKRRLDNENLQLARARRVVEQQEKARKLRESR